MLMPMQVGYTGGKKVDNNLNDISTQISQLKPTYHDLGDHTETIQIDFDPRVVSFAQLLALFWHATCIHCIISTHNH